jgi:hypothetical protein
VPHRVYQVTECNAPALPHATTSTVFLVGHRCGVDSEYLTPITVQQLWDELCDTPINEDRQIDEPFYQFERGTHREDIRFWFENVLGMPVAELMRKTPN